MDTPFRRLRTLFLLCALSAPAAPGAAAVFTVINANDSGAGSLRQAILDANAAGGLNTIEWSGALAGGTITLGSDLPTISSGTSLDATNAPSAVTIAGAPFELPLGASGAVTFQNGSATQDWTVSSVISGSGSLNKTGAGTLILSGVNTYTGGTTLRQGVLDVNSDAALGDAASTVTFRGGTLRTANGGIDFVHSLKLAGSGTLDTQGFDSQIDGLISGGGHLTILGAGAVTMTGPNTYTGGTTFADGSLILSTDTSLGRGAVTFNGGTLDTTGTDILLHNHLTLGSLGGTIDTTNGNWTLAGSISGPGALTVTGGGLVTLKGSNSYAGGTNFTTETLSIDKDDSLGTGAVNFDGGTLQTASTVTLRNAVVLGAGGATIDTLGNKSTLSGLISGAGTLTSVSTATLVLTHANTYTGGTVVNGGTLSVMRDTNLGGAAGGLTLDGGTLKTTMNLDSARAVTLNAGGGTIDTDGHSDLFSGVFGGAGGLTKTGLGTLTLNQTETYAGATTVDKGVLALAADNVLPAATALTVAHGATFDLGARNQTVDSYAGGGAVKMILGANQLAVTNNADLNNGTLNLSMPAGPLLVNGQTFTPLTYGSVTSTWTIVSPAAFSFTPVYGANSLTLTAVSVPFAKIARSGNQAQVGSSLEAIRAAPNADQTTVLQSLYAMDAGQLQAALDQIGPVALASMQGVGLAASGAQTAAVEQRLTALAAGSDLGGYANYTVRGRSMFPGTLVAAAGAGDDAGIFAPRREGTGSPWGFFTSGAIATGKLAEANSASGRQPGYALDAGGLVAGADYRLDETLAVGGSAGYLRSHASIDGGGTVDDYSARYGLYAAQNDGGFHAKAYLGGANDFFKTRRGITFGGVARTATGQPTGAELNASASASYDFRSVEWGILSPFAGLNYDRLMIGGFREDGAETLNLVVDKQTAQSLRSSLGLRYSQKLVGETHAYVPYVSLGWRHELRNQSRPISAQFASGVGAPFTVATGNPENDGTLLGAGISMSMGRRTTGRLDYEGEFRPHFQSTQVGATVRWTF